MALTLQQKKNIGLGVKRAHEARKLVNTSRSGIPVAMELLRLQEQFIVSVIDKYVHRLVEALEKGVK